MNLTEQIISEKIENSDIRIIKQIINNEKLLEHVLKRQVISEKKLINDHLIPLYHLKNLKKLGKISYFTTKGTFNSLTKGSKYFYFLDEVENLFSKSIKFNESFVFRYNLLSRLLLEISDLFIPEQDKNILHKLLIENKSIEELADEEYVSRQRITQKLHKTERRIIYGVYNLKKMHSDYDDFWDLRYQHSILKKANDELYNKFLRQQQAEENAKLNLNKFTSHFIKHGLPLEDLNIPIMDITKSYDLTVRTLNCLKVADIDTLETLLCYRRSDLLKFRNFGKKSLIELENWLLENYKWTLN